VEMGYLTVLHVRLSAKIGDLHAKDSHSFRNRLIPLTARFTLELYPRQCAYTRKVPDPLPLISFNSVHGERKGWAGLYELVPKRRLWLRL